MEKKSYRPLALELLWATMLVSLVVVCRLAIHVPNLQPVMAVSLFAGFIFHRRAIACCIPLAGMALTDGVIGGYQWQVWLVVYLALMMPLLPGWRMSRCQSTAGIAGRGAAWSIFAACFFYLTTNVAVWQFSTWYTGTLGGLLQCLAMGLPFLKYTLAGNLLFGGGLFGTYLACRYFLARRGDLSQSCMAKTGLGVPND